MFLHALLHYVEVLTITKFKIHQCILTTGSPNLMTHQFPIILFHCRCVSMLLLRVYMCSVDVSSLCKLHLMPKTSDMNVHHLIRGHLSEGTYGGLYVYHVPREEWACLQPDLQPSKKYMHPLVPRSDHALLFNQVRVASPSPWQQPLHLYNILISIE